MQFKRRVGSVGAPRFPSTVAKPSNVSESVPAGFRTLRLLDYKYDNARDIVLWKVEDLTEGTQENMRIITYAFPSRDLVAGLGVRTNLKLPEEEILKLSEIIKNKPQPFTMEIHRTARLANAEWIKKAGSPEELLKAHDEFNEYPFREVQEIIAEEDEVRKQQR